MKEDIKKRIEVLEGEIEQHQADYEKLPTIIVSKQGAIFELKKLIKTNKKDIKD
ncbi:hypothetical protein KAR91_69550 [Candidatus Pacearchaeota archaeon]|nr:hypothetical protein [Candidatus Pacearchaeota archaeon]